MLPRTIAPIVAAALVAGAAAHAHAQTVNRIVLRVNDKIATLHDYEELRTGRVGALMRSRLPPERRQELMATVETDTMSTLFEELLVLSRAEQLGVTAPPERVSSAIERNKKAMGIETPEQFTQALAQSGMTQEELYESTRKNLIIQEVISREVSSKVDLTEEDLRRYYSTNQRLFERPKRLSLRELVVLEEGGAPVEERRRLAEELAGKIAAGELEDSEVEELAERGLITRWVELGWVESGDLDQQIEAAIWDLEAGDSAPPVEARGGLHLVEVVDREEPGLRPFKEVEQEIRQREEARAFQEEMARYLRELERAAYIVSNPPPGAADFRATLFGDSVVTDPLLEFDRMPEAPAEDEVEAEPDGQG